MFSIGISRKLQTQNFECPGLEHRDTTTIWLLVFLPRLSTVGAFLPAFVLHI